MRGHLQCPLLFSVLCNDLKNFPAIDHSQLKTPLVPILKSSGSQSTAPRSPLLFYSSVSSGSLPRCLARCLSLEAFFAVAPAAFPKVAVPAAPTLSFPKSSLLSRRLPLLSLPTAFALKLSASGGFSLLSTSKVLPQCFRPLAAFLPSYKMSFPRSLPDVRFVVFHFDLTSLILYLPVNFPGTISLHCPAPYYAAPRRCASPASTAGGVGVC